MQHDPMFWRTAGKCAVVAVLVVWALVLAARVARNAERAEASRILLREAQSQFRYRTGPTDEDEMYRAFGLDMPDTTDDRKLAS